MEGNVNVVVPEVALIQSETARGRVLLPHKEETRRTIQKLARIWKQILPIIRQYCQ